MIRSVIRSVQIIVAAVVLLAFTAPAYANYCPSLMSGIDEALQTASSLSSAKVDEIKRLRDEGAASHRAGNHGESIARLKKALALLKE